MAMQAMHLKSVNIRNWIPYEIQMLHSNDILDSNNQVKFYLCSYNTGYCKTDHTLMCQ